MRISKLVSIEDQEVRIELGVSDIREALAESFADVRNHPEACAELRGTLNSVGCFLKAITDEQIKLLSPEAREIVREFFTEQAERYKP